ncbi:putative molybdenum carrier protein [Marinobacter persicus]|uniref:Molybdenum carrier protein n=1 Tax=Marinobacter persicus TaxID=930118 RepID=A0A2S6G1U9_9GAMM|nr:putative molybdenum carrier protein [Marinobacter persicus]PPK49083.1 putative molybdenum carrier protein [Marinobacter persicus]PPK50547.1 putative molybdenum carrier protein [Marinobacter persicus]PPK54821.1 putative molybdenum carrier protein [Marinobacter persicus]
MKARKFLSSVISGGQTGADRAALDAALERCFPAGGYCPKGRLAEDGPIPPRYPMEELSGGYRARTRKNIQAADGTVVFYHREIEGGTALTVSIALKEKSPLKLIDTETVAAETAMELISAFCIQHEIGILNVAGPRASKCESIYGYVYVVVKRMLLAQAASLDADSALGNDALTRNIPKNGQSAKCSH